MIDDGVERINVRRNPRLRLAGWHGGNGHCEGRFEMADGGTIDSGRPDLPVSMDVQKQGKTRRRADAPGVDVEHNHGGSVVA